MKKNWKFQLINNSTTSYFIIPSFYDTNLVQHCFTTRIGGVSPKPYASLNLGTKTLDNEETVRMNYSIISSALGINPSKIIISEQIHSDEVRSIKGYSKINTDIFDINLKKADGMITNERNITLVTLYADCVPIFFLDPKIKAIGLNHAGWKGTVKKIGGKTVKNMIKEFNSSPSNIIVGIGPSIGSCCYEVDEKVIKEFKNSYKNSSIFINDKGNGKYMLNLWEANKISLLEAGIKEENITISNICTRCNNELFYSYRGEDGTTGRMAAIIKLK